MTSKTGRRQFLQRTVTGSLAGATGLGFLGKLRPVSGQEARLEPQRVQFSPEIEPLVRLIEDTPRDELIATIARRIQGGLPYRRLLAALLLAGVRNIQPRPSVGFKFHAVLVVNSAHLASLSAADEDRWLPLLWALDYFKSSQARDVQEGDWTMRPVAESQVPSAASARTGIYRRHGPLGPGCRRRRRGGAGTDGHRERDFRIVLSLRSARYAFDWT